MSHFLTLRTGLPTDHQFSPRYFFASFELAQAFGESALDGRAEYLIEDERAPVAYRLKDDT